METDIEDNAESLPEKPLEIVYILTNPSMPGLVKIGRTGNLQTRVAALSAVTSVPEPFVIAYAAHVEDAAFVERALHATFSMHRMPGKEFFKISPTNAIAALSLAEVSQVVLDVEEEQPTQIIEEIRVRNIVRREYGKEIDPATHPVVLALAANGGSVSSHSELAELLGIDEGAATRRRHEVEDQLLVTRHGKQLRIALRA
jgi:hypothetical protein